ncbi:MAG: TIGR03862 family flavoprotein [Rhodobacteraceae bacterium]|nr:TIGR03862 family flavoprotein [Paracoccaceae bacterium]
MSQKTALIIGGGPAGLMAAEMLADAGHAVSVVDAKPTVGRKFLMAGKSGLNLTKNEPPEVFFPVFGEARDWLEPILWEFGPMEVQEWAEALGQTVFTGSSGRVFPDAMKASPLLRAWLTRLRGKGITFLNGWHWTGWREKTAVFDTADGEKTLSPDATVLALGGASWARLGSDGQWAKHFDKDEIAPFQPANMGFTVAWSKYMEPVFGKPIKPVRVRVGDHSYRGEFVISRTGVEGGAIYTLSRHLREAMTDKGVTLIVDLFPDVPLDTLRNRISRPRGKASLANHLRKSIGLKGAKMALFNEFAPARGVSSPKRLADILKALPMQLQGPRPIDEAISTAGGVKQAALNDGLMLKSRAGVFCAGEMLDWEAPTGGYLLTTCLATGRHAGLAAVKYLAADK